MKRQIINIDEEKCDGCGLCVSSCAEGAIQIVDGKARLVSEIYCDGLGACLGECPQGALTIEEREADGFDPAAVERHLADTSGGGESPKDNTPRAAVGRAASGADKTGAHSHDGSSACGCPGSMAQTLSARSTAPAPGADASETTPSSLSNWPVQIHLVPVQAPYLDGAKLTIAADCTPFAFADFHRRFLNDRVLLVGCPKLDDAAFYRGKLADIFRENDIASVDVVYMEVPCCNGLIQLVDLAISDSGKQIPTTRTKIGIRGDILATG